MNANAKDSSTPRPADDAARASVLRRPVAGGLHAAADAITQASQRLWATQRISEGTADVGQGLADGLESSAAYLDSHDAAQMAGDALALARRYPLQAMLVAGAVGLACGWLARGLVGRSPPRVSPASHARRARQGRRAR